MKREYVDEIIREKKREFYKNNPQGVLPNLSFYWGRDGYKQLRQYLAANGDKVVDDYLKVQPFRFLGVDNYWNKRKKGFCINIK